MSERVALLWSGGKDSALALWELQRGGEYEVSVLLTTITEEYDRISTHGVRRSLLEQQAAALGLSLKQVGIPKWCTNEEYATKMVIACEELKQAGLTTVAAGDIFLEDVRRYREEQLATTGMRAVFPLWGRDPAELTRTFLAAGFEAVTICVDGQALGREWAGRIFDERFLADLPSGVDPCGENSEFHTFVYSGPIFTRSIGWMRGEIVLRDERFYYCDLLSAS